MNTRVREYIHLGRNSYSLWLGGRRNDRIGRIGIGLEEAEFNQDKSKIQVVMPETSLPIQLSRFIIAKQGHSTPRNSRHLVWNIKLGKERQQLG